MLNGVERVFDIFICGCDLNLTEDNILSHCASNDVVPKQCESLATRSFWYKPFNPAERTLIKLHGCARGSHRPIDDLS